VLLADRVRAAVLADRTAMGLAAAFSEGEVELPDPDEAVARFDAALESDAGPEQDMDPETRDLMVAFGFWKG
jgi:hypothetical protein